MRLINSISPALLVAGILSFTADEAQCQTPYVISHTNGTYTPITGGTVHVPVENNPGDGFTNWDEGHAEIVMPFSFAFFGGTFSTVYIYTNGFLSFDTPLVNGPSVLGPPFTIPNMANPVHNFIGPAWDDLDGGVNAEFRSETLGTAPNRIFVVQATNLTEFFNPATNVDFQVRFYEDNGQFDIVYGTNNGIAGSTVGIEDATGAEGFNLFAVSPTCGVGCSCNPGGCGSTSWQPPGKTISVALPNDPELSANITVPPGAFPGTNFDVDVSLRNLGLVDAGAYNFDLYITNTNTSTVGGTFLGSYAQNGHVSATIIDRVESVTMPAAQGVGIFYVAIVVDTNDTVAEVLENNNVSFSGPIATAEDLTGSVTAPATTGPGEIMDITFTLDNLGAPVTSPVNVRFYFSTDQTLDQFDEFIDSLMFTLPDGFQFTGNVPLTVPANIQPSPPTYYVIADIDDQDQVIESDETNNEVASDTTVDVDGPDLEVTVFDGGPIAFVGVPYPVELTIVNQGGATATDFTACVILSDNLLISLVTDDTLAQTGPITLAPGEQQIVQLQPTMPLMGGVYTSTGTYHIAGVADCGAIINEAIETNNIKRRPQEILLRQPAADFEPLQVSTTSAAAAGEQLPVSIRFANMGNAVGSTHLRLVISEGPGATLQDPTIYDSMMTTTLSPAEETTASVWAQLPGDLASGNYYVGAIVDPNDDVDEVFEDNNTVEFGPVVVVGADLAIVSPAPPPAIIGVEYTRRFAAVGGNATYAWEIEWDSGGAPTGLGFDTALGELSGTPDASAEGRHDFTVRVTSGNLIAERDYSLIITPPTIGLEVVSSRLPPALAQEPYSVQLVAVGGSPPYSWFLTGGNVPGGISVASDGELGGEPQLVGAFTFEVQVRDVTGAAATGILALDVVDPSASITITTADVPDGEVGRSYEHSFAAANGQIPYTWRLEGDIPGLSFDSMTAVLAGTPTVAGDYGIIVEVRDNRQLLDRNAYVLSILEEGALQITNGQSSETGLPSGRVGVEYLEESGEQVRLRAVKPGGELTGVFWTILDGDLPPGITLDGSTGLFSGTPSEAGAFPFIVQVRDSANDFARTSLVIFVEPADGTGPGPGDDDGGCGCAAAEQSGSGSLASILLLMGLGLLLSSRRRLLPFLFAFALFTVTPSVAPAQPVPYQVFEEVEPYTQLGPQALQTIPLGDGTTTSVAIPFDFYFYGQPYNTIYINANGLIGVLDPGFGNHFPSFQMPSAHPAQRLDRRPVGRLVRRSGRLLRRE